MHLLDVLHASLFCVMSLVEHFVHPSTPTHEWQDLSLCNDRQKNLLHRVCNGKFFSVESVYNELFLIAHT